MKKYYLRIYAVFIVAMIICLTLYFLIEATDIKNLIGNVFSGLITGIIVSIVANIKTVLIYKNDKDISYLRGIMESIMDTIELDAHFCEQEKINTLEFAHIFHVLNENFKKISKIDFKELKDYISINNIDMNMGEKLEKQILTQLEGVLYMSNAEFKKFEKQILDTIMVQIRLREIIKKKYEVITNENDDFKETII